METAPSTIADVVIGWFEQYELDELRHEEEAFLVTRPVLKIVQRADQARRQGDWRTALRDCQLALAAVPSQQGDGGEDVTEDDADVARQTAYTQAVVHLYFGMALLANSAVLTNGADRYLDAALRQCQKSAQGFQRSESQRAESIAWAAISLVNAGRRKWADALSACQKSVALIDKMATKDSSLKELRGQIVRTVPMVLNHPEQDVGSG